jgi:Protein of unknown function (DUF1559)
MSDPNRGAVGRFLPRLAVVLAILLVLVTMLAGAVLRVQDAADRVSCNLGGVVLALHSYQDNHGALPPAVLHGKDGKPLHSWRVLILPYMSIEEVELYKEVRLDEPWDSPHNLRLLERMPRSYAAPGRKARRAPSGHTFLRVFVGKGTAFEERPGRGLKMPDDFPDGTSQTLLFVEAGEPVPWTMPEALGYDPDGPLPELRGPFHDLFRACTADGSYRSIRYDAPEATLRALITRNAGDEPGDGW